MPQGSKKFNKFLKFSYLTDVNNATFKFVKFKHRNKMLTMSIFFLSPIHLNILPPDSLSATSSPSIKLCFSSAVLNSELCSVLSGLRQKPSCQPFVNSQFSPTDFQIRISYLCVLFKVTDRSAEQL